MWDIFSRVFFPNFSIFESYCPRIRRIIKPSLNPITTYDIVAIFSNPVAEQFRNQNLVFAVLCTDAQNGPIWSCINFVNDALENGLGKFDYFSKMS